MGPEPTYEFFFLITENWALSFLPSLNHIIISSQ